MSTARSARRWDRVGTASAWAAAIAVLAVLVGIIGYLLAIGLGHVSFGFLTKPPSELAAGGGIGPELWNTIYMAIVSTAIVTPLGVGAAVWLARYAQPGKLVDVVRFSGEALATLPSIVFGMFGFLVFVVALGWGFSRLGAALTLALLNLPLMMRTAEEAVRGVPRELEEASLALGATRWQTLWRITLPTALPGIITGVVLTAGRVFGESAPLLFTAGTSVSRSHPYSLDPRAGGETLAVHLWYVRSEGLVPDATEVAAGTAAVLILVVLLFNLGAALVSSRYGRPTAKQR